MLKYILTKSLVTSSVFVLAYTLGQNLWAYPTYDGISFGFGEFGYHHTFSSQESNLRSE